MKKQRIIDNIKAGVLLACSLCWSTQEAEAQGLSAAGMEQLKTQRLWAQSANAAGMVFDDTSNYSDLNLGYNWQKGDFQRPQDGAKETSFNVSSEGFINLKNAYVWGAFSFTEKNMTDAGYNASITDPYRGMPYYVVDSHLSNWRNQYYNLQFRAATPLLWNRWAFGIEGTYAASIAAKQRDPRVDSRCYTLELIPGVTYQLSEQHKLGFSFKYTSLKEDSRMDREDSNTDHDYYIMYGLGVAVKGIGTGRTADYYGDRFGGALQYNYSTSGLNLLLEAAYDVKAETVTQNYLSTPKKDAAVKDKNARLTALLHQQGEKFSHFLKADYNYRHIDGIQYLSQRDNTEAAEGWIELYSSIRSTYETQAINLDYAFSKNRGTEYNWKLNLIANYTKQADEYLLPNSVKNIENLQLSLFAKKNFVVGKEMNRRLLLDVHATYKQNLSGEYVYGGTHADYLTVTELETRDCNYLMSDYWRLGASLTYSQQVKKAQKMNLFAKAAVDCMTTSDYEFNDRTYVSFSLGCNF